MIISITSSPDDVARLRANAACRGVLRLSFPDADAASQRFPEEALFSKAHAAQIWEFVHTHRSQIERVVVHCDAGVSRSAAVAAAIARRLNGDDSQFFGGRYTPNMRVYRLLVDDPAAGEERPTSSDRWHDH